jgi:hypothetical protein
VILFAGLFIEANLNHIIDRMGKTEDMNRFLGEGRFHGLMGKLGWFYNEFIGRDKARTRRDMFVKGISRKLFRKFKGFYKIYEFRNSVSHGVIMNSYTKLSIAKKL